MFELLAVLVAYVAAFVIIAALSVVKFVFNSCCCRRSAFFPIIAILVIVKVGLLITAGTGSWPR